jgi:murein DD-endopeptidase MepM/ murein hydrolase activator NlpD
MPLITAPILVFAFTLGISAPGPTWPVEPAAVVARFEPPAHVGAPGHRGIDLGASTGQTVRSITAGRIGFSGVIAGKPVVTVLLSDGRRVTYEPVHSAHAAGAPVAAGDVLGTVAASGGHCGGLAGCLHIGLLRGDRYLDPMTLFRRPAILKPLGFPPPSGLPRPHS